MMTSRTSTSNLMDSKTRRRPREGFTCLPFGFSRLSRCGRPLSNTRAVSAHKLHNWHGCFHPLRCDSGCGRRNRRAGETNISQRCAFIFCQRTVHRTGVEYLSACTSPGPSFLKDLPPARGWRSTSTCHIAKAAKRAGTPNQHAKCNLATSRPCCWPLPHLDNPRA